MNDKISIIVPIYNVEQYIRKCIESLMGQTYKNIEIILVDDGSKDNSYEICKEYAEKDGRIKLIHKENGGLSDARNVGIENATGEYITLLDSDDWFSYNFCEIMLKEIKEQSADIVMCEMEPVYTDDYSFNIPNDYTKQNYSNLEALEKFEDTLHVVAQAKLYKREMFNELRYKVGKIHEDEFMFHRMLFQAKKICCLNLKLYAYRQRENSITTSKFNVKRLHGVEALEDRIEFYEEKELTNLKNKTEAIYMFLMKKYIKVLNESDIEEKEKYIKELEVKLKDYYRKCKKTKYLSFKFYIFSKLAAKSDRLFKYYVYK